MRTEQELRQELASVLDCAYATPREMEMIIENLRTPLSAVNSNLPKTEKELDLIIYACQVNALKFALKEHDFLLSYMNEKEYERMKRKVSPIVRKKK